MYIVNGNLSVINSKFNLDSTKITFWMGTCNPIHINLFIKHHFNFFFCFEI